MNTYEISLELPSGKTINVVTAAPTMAVAEAEVRQMLRELQEEAFMSGRTVELGTHQCHSVEVREVWADA